VETCSYCERAIEGAFARWGDGRVACDPCRHAGHPECPRCRRPALAPVTLGAATYCGACVADLPKCGLCAQPIAGRYLKHPKLGPVCEPCKASAASCQRCGALTQEPKVHADTTFCPSCWEAAPRCDACKEPLGQRAFRVASQPDKRFCEPCSTQAAACDFCGQPAGTDHHTYPDGRDSCADCRRTAVVDPAVLEELHQTARAWLRERLGFELPPPEECPVELVGAHRIAEVQRKAFSATPGFDQRERGLFSVVTETLRNGVEFVSETHTFAIYIEDGLPLDECYGTVVHELVHLWQFRHFPRRPVHRQYVEGLATWAQVHALEERGAAVPARMLRENVDPTYGGGLRIVLELEQQHGRERTPSALVTRVGGKL